MAESAEGGYPRSDTQMYISTPSTFILSENNLNPQIVKLVESSHRTGLTKFHVVDKKQGKYPGQILPHAAACKLFVKSKQVCLHSWYCDNHGILNDWMERPYLHFLRPPTHLLSPIPPHQCHSPVTNSPTNHPTAESTHIVQPFWGKIPFLVITLTQV